MGNGKHIRLLSKIRTITLRDEFTAKTKETLAKRVGYRCTKPTCSRLTIGPGSEADKLDNIGVAAHITAASKGGPRYETDIIPEERKSLDNGIWLCQNCAKLIDDDPARFETALIRTWKADAEKRTSIELETGNSFQSIKPQPQKNKESDANSEFLKEYFQLFDSHSVDEFNIGCKTSLLTKNALLVIRQLIVHLVNNENEKIQKKYSVLNSSMELIFDLVYSFHDTHLLPFSKELKELENAINNYGTLLNNPSSENEHRVIALEKLISTLVELNNKLYDRYPNESFDKRFKENIFSQVSESEKHLRNSVIFLQQKNMVESISHFERYKKQIKAMSDFIYINKDNCMEPFMSVMNNFESANINFMEATDSQDQSQRAQLLSVLLSSISVVKKELINSLNKS